MKSSDLNPFSAPIGSPLFVGFRPDRWVLAVSSHQVVHRRERGETFEGGVWS